MNKRMQVDCQLEERTAPSEGSSDRPSRRICQASVIFIYFSRSDAVICDAAPLSYLYKETDIVKCTLFFRFLFPVKERILG